MITLFPASKTSITYVDGENNFTIDQLKQALQNGTTPILLMSCIQSLQENEIEGKFFSWLIPQLPNFYPNYYSHKLILQLLVNNRQEPDEIFTQEHLRLALDANLQDDVILYLLTGLEFEAVDKKIIQIAKEKNYSTAVLESMLLSLNISEIDDEIINLAIEKKCSESVFKMLTWHLMPGQCITNKLITAAQTGGLSERIITLLTSIKR